MPIPQRKQKFIRESAKEKIYRTLQSWIVNGTMKPGERISDQEIAEYFDVSRTPVREALQRLSEQGLVYVEPSKGTHVSPLDENNTFTIYEALALLSGCAARLACQKQKNGDIQKLRELNAVFQKAIEAGENQKLATFDNQFHVYLLEMADNAYISDIIYTLTLHANRCENLYFERGPDKMASVREHNAIIDAIEAHEPEASGRYAEENWLGFYHRRLAKIL